MHVHGVVENTIHVVLVRAKTIWIAVSHFASHENASGLFKSGPECSVNMLDCIDTKAINW